MSESYDFSHGLRSELLGHSSIKITQEYYGKIVQRRVSEEIKRFGNKLRNKV